MSSIRAGVKIDRNRLRESASPVAHKSKLPVYGKWVGLMVIASAANSALATILYEPFNYDATSTPRLDGQTASTGKSWQVAGSNAGNPGPNPANSGYMTSAINAGNIGGPAGAPAATGNYLQWGNTSNAAPSGASGVADRIDIGGYNTGAVYYSMQFRIDDLTGAVTGATGAFVAGLNNSPGTQTATISAAGARLIVRRDSGDSTKFDLGVNTNVSNATTNWTSALNVGQTYFVVESYDFGPTPDAASLWVNPDSATFGTGTPPTATQTATGSTPVGSLPGVDLAAGTTGYKIASFLFRQASTAPAKMSADELRIDTTWAGVTAVEWVSTGDNTWGASSNWSNFYTGSTGSAPGAQGADITFGNNSNVFNVSLDSPRTVGTLRFNSSSSYTISGPGTLTIDTPTSGDLNTSADNTSASYIAGAANPGQLIVLQGSHTISAPVVMNRSTTLNVAASSSLAITGNLSSTGTVTLGQTGSGVANLHPTSLQVVSGTLKLASGLSTIRAGSLNVASGAALDLTNGKLIYDYANGGAPDPTRLSAVQSLVTSGYASGSWNGTGIASSTAASVAASTTNFNKTAIGFAEASATGLTSFAGVNTDSDMILVRYTYSGDANLSGTVDTSDFTLLAQNFGKTSQSWVNGDFNYDGVVNALDFNALATNFGIQALPASPALGTLVPEPGSMAILLLGAGLLKRGKRGKASC